MAYYEFGIRCQHGQDVDLVFCKCWITLLMDVYELKIQVNDFVKDIDLLSMLSALFQ